MEAEPAIVAAFHAALPDDPNVEIKKMFGMPAAFLNRQMFFGIFEGTLVARVGPSKVDTLVDQPGKRVFSPSPERAWPDYVQVEASEDAAVLASLAADALRFVAKLPKKVKKPKR